MVAAFVAGAYTTVYLVDSIRVEKEIIERKEIIGEDAIAPAVSEIYDAVVLIELRQLDTISGTGTGFVYKKDDNYGYIITNYHVVERANEIVVVLTNENEVSAELVGTDVFTDLAVLRIDADEVIQVATLGNSGDTEVGERVFTVGSPLGRQYMGTVTQGILSARERLVETLLSNQTILFEVLQTDAAINPGNSGGPLVNQKGEVIGVNSMKIVRDAIEGMGFAIPIENAIDIINVLEKGEEVKRPVLGVTMIDANDRTALYFHRIMLPEVFDSGVVLIDIKENSDADKGGLRPLDVVLELNDTVVKNSAHFRFLLYQNKIGDEIEVKISRNGEIIELTVQLESRLMLD